MIETGHNYKMIDSNGKQYAYEIVDYDPQNGTYGVADLQNGGRRYAQKDLRNFTVLKSLRKCSVPSKKANVNTSSSTTQLYIVQTGSGTYKIGCTDDLEARMRAGKTWCANMRQVTSRTIPKHKTQNWRRYESKVHKRVAKNRCANGGNEVFKLNMSGLKDAVKYMHNMRFD